MKSFNEKLQRQSWSFLSSFWWDKEKWFLKYFIEKEPNSTPEIEFGKQFADSIEDGTCKITTLMNRLAEKKEYPFSISFHDLLLVGYVDAFDEKTKCKIDEVKTGKIPWTQKRADQHEQITMYCLMNYLTNKIPPEKVRCELHWLPTKSNGDFSISFVEPVTVHTFLTKRTMKDILKFALKIDETVEEMRSFIKKKISTGDNLTFL